MSLLMMQIHFILQNKMVRIVGVRRTEQSAGIIVGDFDPNIIRYDPYKSISDSDK